MTGAVVDRQVGGYSIYSARLLRRGFMLEYVKLGWNVAGFGLEALQAPRHHPLSDGSVTMSRRSSVSRMRENRTYGLKGGWGNGPSQAPRP
jgi:hypothetical protein